MYKLTTNNSIIRLEDSAVIPKDISNTDYLTYLEWVKNGGNPQQSDSFTQTQMIVKYEVALDNYLDSVARQYRYDDRKSFVLRAGYPGPYQTEGIAFAQWMDNCNVQCYKLLQDVIAGAVEMPTIEEMISSLPVFSLG